jgi:hypothetical protein
MLDSGEVYAARKTLTAHGKLQEIEMHVFSTWLDVLLLGWKRTILAAVVIRRFDKVNLNPRIVLAM